MTQISSEQKLRLLRSIREEHKNNLSTMRSRENLLFGSNLPLVEKAEMNETITVKEHIGVSTNRIRLFLALILFVGFIFLDVTKTDVLGMDTTFFEEKITEDFQSNVFDFMNTIPYTLEEVTTSK